MTESGERKVNLGSLLESVTGGTCLGYALRSRQINHIKFSHSDVLLAVSANLTPLHSDLEEGVRPTGVGIHEGLSHRSILGSNGHDLAHLLRRLGRKVRQILHVDPRVDLLVQVKSIFGILRQQVTDLLIVNF